MDFISIAKQRQSVRSYKNQKVESEKLEQILEAAHVQRQISSQFI